MEFNTDPTKQANFSRETNKFVHSPWMIKFGHNSLSTFSNTLIIRAQR